MATSLLNHIVDGSGPPVVLLHPVGLDIASWDEVARRLSERFSVIRLDLPGHGASSPAPDGGSLRDYAETAVATVASLGRGAAAYVGLSFGGMIAQTIGIEFPQQCRALVVSGCPCTMPDPARQMMRQRGATALEGGMAAIVDDTLARWFTPAFLAAGGAEPTRARLLADDPRGWAAAWNAISGLDTLGRLGAIEAPTLCIAGSLDLGASVDSVRQIALNIRGARFQILEGAPHMMQIEAVDRYASAVDTFLSGI